MARRARRGEGGRAGGANGGSIRAIGQETYREEGKLTCQGEIDIIVRHSFPASPDLQIKAQNGQERGRGSKLICRKGSSQHASSKYRLHLWNVFPMSACAVWSRLKMKRLIGQSNGSVSYTAAEDT
jgi:hypothetical protein